MLKSNNNSCCLKNEIKLIFTGDLLPADRHQTPGIGVGSKISKGKDLWSNEISSFFKSADKVIVNLEAPLVDSPKNTKKHAFLGRKEIIDNFKYCNITHANVANNHILEHGEENFYKTLSLLQESNITPIGTQLNKITKLQLDGRISISMAAFNAIHDIPNSGCYNVLTEEAVLSSLSHPDMKNAQIKILVFHWGNEYIHIPSWDQIQLARKCIDNGANIIIGHHPHVIQPVEKYKNGLICYSLGNFLFDMLWNKSVRTGLILEIDIKSDTSFTWKTLFCRYNNNLKVKLINNNIAIKMIQNYHNEMMKCEAKGEYIYRKNYRGKLKINHFLARIQMKKQLFLQLRYLTGDERSVVFKGIIHKMTNKLQGSR